MKIKMVNVEDGIISYGFRKITAFVEHLNKDTQTYFVIPSVDSRSIAGKIFPKSDKTLSDEAIDEIAQHLSDSDIIGFSSMTAYADLTKNIIRRVKDLSKHPFIIYGGIHPIIQSDDAIMSEADAICTGEGEFAFHEFYDLYKDGKDFTPVKNFWFKNKNNIIRNSFRPLMTSKEMNALPFAKYGDDEKLYKKGYGFKTASLADYLASNGLSYNTLWTIGCPNRCTYCGNSKFIANDPHYRIIRHTDPRYIADEVKQVIRKHPHIKTVIFNDDNFMSVKYDTIREFSELWHGEVKLPFAVLGVYPGNLKAEKLEILTWAGLNRVRMGIQSGSERILKFYKRPTSVEKIIESTMKISKFSRYHVPPGYDIIVDNPIETQQDVIDTLELVYKLPRPFVLYIYSLRIIPNTELEKVMKEYGADFRNINTDYFIINPTLSNMLLYLLTFYKPPRWIFNKLLKNVHPGHTPQKKYHALAIIINLIYGIKRGFDYLRFMDFSTILGKSGYYLWRLGLIDFWHKHINAKMPKPDMAKQITTASGD